MDIRGWRAKVRPWLVAAAVALALAVTAAGVERVPPAAAAQQPQALTCMTDVCRVTGAWTCQALDVRITNLTTVGVTEYCDSPTDTGTYTFQMELTPQAQARYDVAFWLATDGGTGATGECYSTYLPPPLLTTGLPLPPNPLTGPPFWDLEAYLGDDLCGDVRASQLTYYKFSATIPCTDANGDGQVDDIGSCLGWDQDAVIDCPANGACPDTGSKCRCEPVPIEVVNYPIDLSLTKEAPECVPLGDEFDYTITVTNLDSTLASTGFTLVDTLPAGLTFVSSTPDVCTADGQTVTCVVTADLAAEGSTSLVLTVQLDANFTGDLLTNSATVTGFERDLVTSNNTGTATIECFYDPTAVELLWFEATGGRRMVTLGWETASEIDNLGFNLYRATSVDGPRTRINAELIPTNVPPGSPFGAVYEYVDSGLKPKTTYYYWLEDVDIYGQTGLHGPVSATTLRFLTILGRR